MVPLGLLNDGESGEIVALHTKQVPAIDERCDGRAEEMGIRAGKRVQMLSNGARAVLVKVDESRIALDRGVAMRIVVRR